MSFDTLSVAVLRMLAQAMHISLHERDCDEFSPLLRSTPPGPEVPEALERLADAGFALVTLTNFGRQSSEAALERGRIAQRFDRTFSVEEVRRYKPSRQTYDLVADELDVNPGRFRLVAAHTWETLGPLAAGYAAALITRSRELPASRGPPARNYRARPTCRGNPHHFGGRLISDCFTCKALSRAPNRLAYLAG
jgi:2-haloacid dehalogenase